MFDNVSNTNWAMVDMANYFGLNGFVISEKDYGELIDPPGFFKKHFGKKELPENGKYIHPFDDENTGFHYFFIVCDKKDRKQFVLSLKRTLLYYVSYVGLRNKEGVPLTLLPHKNRLYYGTLVDGSARILQGPYRVFVDNYGKKSFITLICKPIDEESMAKFGFRNQNSEDQINPIGNDDYDMLFGSLSLEKKENPEQS
jgi:hypothetical protein